MKKQCSKCGKQKSLSEFYKRPKGKNGLCGRCKKCMMDYVKEYRQTFIGYLRSRFQLMKQRCVNPNNPKYKDYGGRDIKCLFKSSDEFIDYVINELKINPKKLQIDRIDNDGHYEPGNIRFVTSKINNNNRRNSKNNNNNIRPA